MANKLPWMKHDHNARNDDFIKRACARFGHFGYSGWFRLLEVLHEHGTGDNLCITKSRLASELGSRWPQVRLLLDFSRTSGKVDFTEDGLEINLTVKNFKKKQKNKYLKSPDDGNCDVVKPQQEEEGEGDGENNKYGLGKIINDLAHHLWVKRWTTSDLENHRFPFGKEKGRSVIDMEVSNCEMYLRSIQMDPKTTAALKHRIKIKAQEGIAR